MGDVVGEVGLGVEVRRWGEGESTVGCELVMGMRCWWAVRDGVR